MSTDEKIRFLDNLDEAINFSYDNNGRGASLGVLIAVRNAFAKAFYMENYTKDLNPPVKKHGVDCAKMPHHAAAGYLHAPDDDSPYDVDGLNYCGRCHAAI